MIVPSHLTKTEFVTCCWRETDEGTIITNLKVKEGCTGKGYGTAFMKEFLATHKLPVMLTILYERPLNFYLRLGFEIDGGAITDPITGKIVDADLTYCG